MRIICTLAFAGLLLVPSAVTSSAQTRTRRHTTRRHAASSAANNQQLLSDARARVSNQIKVLTRFLYLFGRISNGIETTDEATRRGSLPPEAAAATDKTKAGIRDNLRSVREGLDQLENYFRTTPGLEPYYTRIAGVAAGAADAEDKAAAGQLDGAGRTLIDVVNRLTDALSQML